MDIVFSIDANDDFKIVVEDLINNLYNNKCSNEILDVSIMITAKEETRGMIFEKKLNIHEISDVLTEKSYDCNKIKMFLDKIEVNRSKLMYLALVNYNSSLGEAVEGFDWALKLVYGTSELKKLHYPIVQIKLTNINKFQKRQRIYDLNKDILCKFIDILEDMNSLL